MPLRARGPDRAHGVWANETEANEACRRWCVEVNAATHAAIAAIPDERLEVERKLLRSLPSLRPPLRRGERRRVDKLATVRIGSARYSVPRELVGRDVVVIAADGEVIIEYGDVLVARHGLVAPGEVSIIDEHYGGPRPGRHGRSARNPVRNGPLSPLAPRRKRSCVTPPPRAPRSSAVNSR